MSDSAQGGDCPDLDVAATGKKAPKSAKMRTCITHKQRGFNRLKWGIAISKTGSNMVLMGMGVI